MIDPEFYPQRKIDELEVEIERLRAALEAIIDANDEFRKSLPDNWDGDPVDDACKLARAALRQKEE